VREVKGRKIRIRVLLAIVAILSISFPAIAQAIPSTINLTVHYQRPNADYQGWNLWLWKNLSGPGDVDVNVNGVEFNSSDDFGKIAKISISGMDKFENIGIIVRKGAWESKDIEADRFITQFKDDGSAEIWLRKGDPSIYYSLPTSPVKENPVVAQGKVFDSQDFAERYTYLGDDLGNTYTQKSTSFRVWAPTATAVNLVTYKSADADSASGQVFPMKSDVKGTWVVAVDGDQDGTIYNYRVSVNSVVNEAVDPYVRATTSNGLRGVVVNLDTTDPKGWNSSKPKFSGKSTDAIIYELHVRDFSMDKSSGISEVNKGKYLAFTEINSSYQGVKTGVSSIKDLGVTHVELLPVFDYATVDENNPTYNWGYDPQNYNVPEGSYSSNPKNPKARIFELKSAISSMHSLGLRVNMDVVYNHVSNASSFSQNLIVPGYFFRTDDNGSLTNGSGCGNDVASERSMVRKFIVDSVKYWATEYNFDGFRFDLMGLMDIQTITETVQALRKIDPTIIVIGEGWNMGSLDPAFRANQMNISKLPNVSMFNDQIRDGVKGSVFDPLDTGFATGKFTALMDVRAGIVGNIDYSSSVVPKWKTLNPGQSVNYVESHDNMTLFDKIQSSVKGVTPIESAKLSRLSTSFAFLAQGLPFMQAGQEFLRSKKGDSNSYKSSDEVNSLKWDTKVANLTTVNYYKGLIALRKAHPSFRMTTAAQIKTGLKFLPAPDGTIAYSLSGSKVGDTASTFVVFHNANTSVQSLTLPKSTTYSVLVEKEKAGVKVLRKFTGSSIKIDPRSTIVLRF
jgi:pullulanase